MATRSCSPDFDSPITSANPVLKPTLDSSLCLIRKEEKQWVTLEYYEDQMGGIHIKTISKIGN